MGREVPSLSCMFKETFLDLGFGQSNDMQDVFDSVCQAIFGALNVFVRGTCVWCVCVRWDQLVFVPAIKLVYPAHNSARITLDSQPPNQYLCVGQILPNQGDEPKLSLARESTPDVLFIRGVVFEFLLRPRFTNFDFADVSENCFWGRKSHWTKMCAEQEVDGTIRAPVCKLILGAVKQ